MRAPDDTSKEAEVRNIALAWGWRTPSKEIVDIANHAYIAKQTKSAQLLVDMGVITDEQRTKWLKSKPSSTQTIEWFAQQDAAVTPVVERVLALKAAYPYYDVLAVLSIHSCMHEEAIAKRAEELDAAVMMIEETVPVVVFSTFRSLINFRSLGRAARQKDPIIRTVGTEVQLAVGARDEISTILKSVRAADDSAGSMESANVWSASSGENQSKAENRVITRLIDHALNVGATDVALKPFRNGQIQVQLRKFGEMISPKTVDDNMNPELARHVVSVLQSKSGANPTSSTQRVPTDGQITYRSGSGDAFLRLSFLPMNHLGELRNLTSVSIRLLPRVESSISLTDLRLDNTVVDELSFAMRSSEGLVLVVGPTNSGKSTTVAGAIGQHVQIFGDRRKRLSVEDPIERYLYGIQQYAVPPGIKDEEKRFEVMLRAFKRHDPDLIWVGEVRDKVTADLCVASASTGHIVLSTLHAKDAVIAFDVLAKTVEPEKRFQLIESMALVISQRLIKELCPHCRVIAAPTSDEQILFEKYIRMVGEKAELPDRIAHANDRGCKHCEEGFIGLLPINEVLPFSREAKDAAIAMMSGAARRDALAKSRTSTLLQSGLQYLADHRVDLDAILV